MRSLLNLREIPRPDDAADGLAIAVTHAFSSRVASLGFEGGKPATSTEGRPGP